MDSSGLAGIICKKSVILTVPPSTKFHILHQGNESVYPFGPWVILILEGFFNLETTAFQRLKAIRTGYFVQGTWITRQVQAEALSLI